MKEKYIFFTLLIVALTLFIGSRMGKSAKDEISAEEKKLQKQLEHAEKKRLPAPEKVDIDKVQDLVAFSYYEGMLKRSPFFKVQPKRAQAVAEAAVLPLPVEEKTPLFLYKGKIILGNREVVMIEHTRLGEVFMVSKGENIAGYKVLDITDTEVILSKKGEENIILKTIENP